ncbi:hypothetical protein DYB25_004587 [Aphanomyces astaci]|uniref:Poly [ADP-ribose] polymerase n=1 Tax=Aphanomyces astaci TaxID=112090 RepID=A0A397ATA4_APHAT|nr:hypothetical protein DYB25_004587 [Aphanomyces astaci]
MVTLLFTRLTKSEIAAAMASVNKAGHTPLLTLVAFERLHKADVDYTAEDNRYCRLLRLYLQHSTQLESMVVIETTESLLHVAASRTLSAANGRWKGADDVLQVVVESHGWPVATVNAPSTATGKTALLLASENGHTRGVYALLRKKADPNLVVKNIDDDSNWTSPLLAAVANGHVEIATYLLQFGGKVSEGFRGLKTPLHVALERNDADMADALLSNGADVCAVNADGLSALSSAILQGFSVTKVELHANEVSFGDSFNAPLNDSWDFLCAKVPTPVATLPPTTNNKKPSEIEVDDDTSEHESQASDTSDDSEEVQEKEEPPVVQNTRISAISVLLSHASAAPAIGLADSRGRTPLHYACGNRDVHLLRALVHLSPAAINARDRHLRTPLHFAVNAAVLTPEATFDIESVLVKHGADVNAVDAFGFTPLHFAFQKVNLDWQYDHPAKSAVDFQEILASVPTEVATDPIETVRNLCLVNGIQVAGQDILGRTCLHVAAATGAVVSSLSILHIAPPELLEMTDQYGDTAVATAMAYGRQAVVTTLIQQRANIQVSFTKNKAKVSLYYSAVEKQWQGVCHLLLNAGYCRRQAVEDSLRSHGFTLTQNLIAGLVNNTKDKSTLTQTNDKGETLLHVLAQQSVEFQGAVRAVAWQLIDAGVSVSATTNQGATAMHFAAIHGDLNLLRFLLHLDPSLVHTLTKSNESPLVFAFKHSTEKYPNALLRSLVFLGRSKANVAQPDAHGHTVLSLVLDRFLDHRTMSQTSQVVLLDLVEFLLQECKVSPNGRFPTTASFVCSPQTNDIVKCVTPLIRAVHISSVFLREHALAMLLHHGANVVETDDQGNTVLMHAVVQNHLDDLRICLGLVPYAERKTVSQTTTLPCEPTKTWTMDISASDRTAALKVANVYGETALHLAVQPRANGSFENVHIVELLLKHKVSIEALDKRKVSAVDLAKLQHSGILLGLLTNSKVVARDVDTCETYAAIPPVDHDATVYLSQCQARGLVKTVPIPLVKSPLCQAGPGANVHVNGVTEFSVLLSKVDVQAGQHGVNVFYRMQVVHNVVQDVFVLFTNWGRMGESGKYQHTPFKCVTSAEDEFKKIFKSKTGNVFGHDLFVKKIGKYMVNPRRRSRHEYHESVTASFSSTSLTHPKSILDNVVQQILGVVTDLKCLEQAATGYDHSLRDMPLVELEPSVLATALDRLSEIKTILDENASVLKKMNSTDQPLEPAQIGALADSWRAATDGIAEKSSRYFELVPRSDASCDDVPLASFLTVDDVNKEITRVRHLLDVAHTSKIILGAKANAVHPLDYCYDAMQVHLTPASTADVDVISAYFEAGFSRKPSTHKVTRVLKVQRKGEAERMQDIAVPGHHTLLWHGTKKSNLMGILSRGLCIAPPEAPTTGYAFGKGIYFADSAEKSFNYCGSDPYTLPDKRKVHYMLLCDVALGTTHRVVEPEYREVAADGTHSTFAMAKYQPNPHDTLVTPIGSCRVPLGKLQQLGEEISLPSAWAIGNIPDFSKSTVRPWMLQTSRLDRAGLALLDKALLTGQSKVEWENSLEVPLQPLHIFGERWAKVTKLELQVEAKEFYVNGRERIVRCHVTLEFENSTKYSYSAHKYFDVVTNESLANGFKFHLERPALTHNEFIVYNQAQVKIAYLVEIEVA